MIVIFYLLLSLSSHLMISILTVQLIFSLSYSGNILCAVGKDSHGKQVMMCFIKGEGHSRNGVFF